ncbi:MAG: glycosyltransferase family 4 protein, partial [Syntrophomonadaceae bacterium]|nr:glycosyltransferase family 4 protein [Syntrophomonadaceae bacterium]
GGELLQWLAELGPKVKVYPITRLCREISPGNDLAALIWLFRLMRREQFDVVHCHSSKAGALARLAARMAGKARVIYTVHGWGVNAPGAAESSRPGSRVITRIESALSRLTDYLVYVCRADQEKAREIGISPRQGERVIYNGVPDITFDHGKLRSEVGLADSDTIVGTVCRLAEQKNIIMFLQVARLVLQKVSGPENLYFVVIGDGPLRQQCQDFVSQNGLNQRVILLGSRPEAWRLVADFDIFALLSRWEGLPISIIEAMLAGRPLVATAVGGVGELVEHGRNGYLVGPSEVEAAAEFIGQLIRDKSLRLQMGNQGRQMASSCFPVKRMLNEYAAVYRGQ